MGKVSGGGEMEIYMKDNTIRGINKDLVFSLVLIKDGNMKVIGVKAE